MGGSPARGSSAGWGLRMDFHRAEGPAFSPGWVGAVQAGMQITKLFARVSWCRTRSSLDLERAGNWELGCLGQFRSEKLALTGGFT